MSDSPDSFVDLVEPTVRENRTALAESLNNALGTKYEVMPQAVVNGKDAMQELIRDEPGIALTFQSGDQGLVCLVPESLPLPKWYREPNDSQDARLQTLPMEWSASIVPPELEIEKYVSVATGNLMKQLMACGLPNDVQCMEIQLQGAMAMQSEAPLLLVWPVATPQFESVADWPVEEVPEEVEESPLPAGATAAPELQRRFARLRGVPIELIVHIASKRIGVKQLRGLSPGTLITFDKTCEDLLDVFVANRLYCRGEAVKVGENFGVKVNEVNPQSARESPIQRI